MKLYQLKGTAKRLLTDFDYSAAGQVFHLWYLVNIRVLCTKFAMFAFHLTCILTMPISVPLLVIAGRKIEIRNLKSWVRQMRSDKGFFSEHYYIEIKRHIKEHESSYQLTLNW